MGKRELLLIVAFLIIGAVVYQATAPPPGPNERSLSLSALLDAARRHIRGNRASAEVVTTSTEALTADVTEVRVVELLSELHVEGSERADIETSLRVRSRAYDDEEARQYAQKTVLKTDRAASSIVFRVQYPKPGRQQAALTLKLPSRLRLRVETRTTKLTIGNVAAVELTNGGGDVAIRKVSGRVAVTHRGGRLLIEDAAAAKLTVRSDDVILNGVRGDVVLAAENGGSVKASRLGGAIEIEARNAEIAIDGLDWSRGPIRVNASGGSVRLDGIGADTRVDGRNTDVELTMSAAAPVVIYTTGESVLLTPPPAGYKLDAVVTEGEFGPESLLAELGLKVSTTPESREIRAAGAVKGGGPAITIRANHADVTLRSAAEPSK